MSNSLVCGPFDDLRLHHVRLLDEAARRGSLHVLLWSDDVIQRLTGQPPKFPLAERKYLIEAIRYVDQLTVVEQLESPDQLPAVDYPDGSTWVVPETKDRPVRRQFCQERNLGYEVISGSALTTVPDEPFDAPSSDSGNRRVLVTGCFDWFHSGHVRFFEEASQFGNLYVVVGSDANIRLLKGEGHPMFPAEQRRYIVGSVRFVTAALVSTGSGWLDAEPEIERIRPHIYAVNEDGDRPEKREYCETHGIEYRVLKRTPKEGLPKRESTALRGF